MARILISYFSDYGETMYDAISAELIRNGNDVFRFNINSPCVKINKWGGNNKLIDDTILEKIENFNPEIVFNFNHSLPINISLSSNCKNCVIDADNPETFWNIEHLKENLDNYYFLGLQKYSHNMYRDFLEFNIKENQNYLFFPPASVVKNIQLNQDKNISFIGSNFYPLDIPRIEGFYDNIGLALYHKFKEDYFYSHKDASCLIGDYPTDKEKLIEVVRAYYVGQERLKYMQAVSDLGFTFYGVRWWNQIAYYDFELADCFDPTPKISLEDNTWVYNTSKISINISHPQAKSSFSWRVMDIMASNACLLMESKPDWHELFSKYLSQEVLDAIIYNDRFDMREKAKKLLADEGLRLRCVQECNHAIEQNGRWHHRLEKLEKFLGVPVVGINNPEPRYTQIVYANPASSEEKQAAFDEASGDKIPLDAKKQTIEKKALSLKNIWSRLGLKSRCKNMIYITLLFIAHIPALGLLISKENRLKYLDEISLTLRKT